MDSLTPNGVFADVLGHKLHVFRSGDKDKPKLVFLSGSGTVAPAYDFKILYSKLTDRYRVIVIEKFGYGYSDLCGIPFCFTTETIYPDIALAVSLNIFCPSGSIWGHYHS